MKEMVKVVVGLTWISGLGDNEFILVLYEQWSELQMMCLIFSIMTTLKPGITLLSTKTF